MKTKQPDVKEITNPKRLTISLVGNDIVVEWPDYLFDNELVYAKITIDRDDRNSWAKANEAVMAILTGTLTWGQRCKLDRKSF